MSETSDLTVRSPRKQASLSFRREELIVLKSLFVTMRKHHGIFTPGVLKALIASEAKFLRALARLEALSAKIDSGAPLLKQARKSPAARAPRGRGYSKHVPCRTCIGTGVKGPSLCEVCGGKGKAPRATIPG